MRALTRIERVIIIYLKGSLFKVPILRIAIHRKIIPSTRFNFISVFFSSFLRGYDLATDPPSN